MSKVTAVVAESRIKCGIPFEASNLRGEGVYVLSQQPTTGQMPEKYATQLLDRTCEVRNRYLAPGQEYGERIGDTYVVYSYQTPIGWLERDELGHVAKAVIPDVYYSGTTSKHQAMVRRAWAGLPGLDA